MNITVVVCRKCGAVFLSHLHPGFHQCLCGAIAVDDLDFRPRVVGDPSNYTIQTICQGADGRGLRFSVTDLISKSGLAFHLTGSRRFGYFKTTSDWDYYISDSVEIRAWLTQHGFIALSESYHDENTTDVFRCDNVDVQLVKDEKRKNEAQTWLLQYVGDKMQKFTRTQQAELWALAYGVTS